MEGIMARQLKRKMDLSNSRRGLRPPLSLFLSQVQIKSSSPAAYDPPIYTCHHFSFYFLFLIFVCSNLFFEFNLPALLAALIGYFREAITRWNCKLCISNACLSVLNSRLHWIQVRHMHAKKAFLQIVF